MKGDAAFYMLLAAAALAVMVERIPTQADTRKVLAAEGYSNVRLTGYEWFDCSRGEIYHQGFVATSATGQKVVGTVCSGVFAGAVVRIDGSVI